MKAAVFTKTQAGKVIQIQELPTPRPRPNEVLIRVRAASVNPLDWRLKRRRPGVDVAGEVESIGQGVSRFKPGDAVFGVCHGAFAEYACASENKLALKPEQLSFEQAASIPVAALTALQGLRDKGHIQPGQKLLINGAAGGIGTFAVQIAEAFGANVTGVCSTKNVDMVRSLGADHVIDYMREDFTATAERYDVILDNVGNRPLSSMRRVLAAGGKCLLAGAPKSFPAMFARVIKAFLWPPFMSQKFVFFVAKVIPADLEFLCGLAGSGKLSPVIDGRYALHQTGDAIDYVETGHARAKVVITMQ